MLNIREIKSLLGFYADMGMDEIISAEPRQWNLRPTEAADTLATTRRPPPVLAQTILAAPDEAVANARKFADQATSLEELRAAVEAFDGCELKKMSKHTVFADGTPQQALVMLIGDAPAADEDRSGIPFCGQSGQLLDEMLAAIRLKRDQNLYLTNILFWRPPGNRAPTPEEIAVCRPFVEKHIALIAPKLLVLAGATAMKALLNEHGGISRVIGRDFNYTNQYLSTPIRARVMYHPSFLLQQPLQKRESWADLLKIKQIIQ